MRSVMTSATSVSSFSALARILRARRRSSRSRRRTSSPPPPPPPPPPARAAAARSARRGRRAARRGGGRTAAEAAAVVEHGEGLREEADARRGRGGGAAASPSPRRTGCSRSAGTRAGCRAASRARAVAGQRDVAAACAAAAGCRRRSARASAALAARAAGGSHADQRLDHHLVERRHRTDQLEAQVKDGGAQRSDWRHGSWRAAGRRGRAFWGGGSWRTRPAAAPPPPSRPPPGSARTRLARQRLRERSFCALFLKGADAAAAASEAGGVSSGAGAPPFAARPTAASPSDAIASHLFAVSGWLRRSIETFSAAVRLCEPSSLAFPFFCKAAVENERPPRSREATSSACSGPISSVARLDALLRVDRGEEEAVRA